MNAIIQSFPFQTTYFALSISRWLSSRIFVKKLDADFFNEFMKAFVEFFGLYKKGLSSQSFGATVVPSEQLQTNPSGRKMIEHLKETNYSYLWV